MNKFLFTDGTHRVIEVHSPEELEELIEQSADTAGIKIWLFNSSGWISYAAYRKLYPAVARLPTPAADASGLHAGILRRHSRLAQPATRRKGARGFRKLLYLAGAFAGVLLVVNFTKIKWEKTEPVSNSAARPGNVPVMDIDSLIYEIEISRGQSLDRSTRSNLRIRNTWPDRILLGLKAERETNGTLSRFFNVDVSIDNTTGHPLDEAVVRLIVWKNNKISLTDTLHFSDIRYDQLAKRELDYRYRGDSISVAFESIRAKAFNFCYSASIKNNSGNYNDRWFCRN